MQTVIDSAAVTQILNIVLVVLAVGATAVFAGVAVTRLRKEPGARLTLIGATLLFLLTLCGIAFRFFVIPRLWDLPGDMSQRILVQQIYGLVYAALNVTAIAFLTAGIVARTRAEYVPTDSHGSR